MKRKLISIIIFLIIGVTLHAYNYGTYKVNSEGCDNGNAKACNDLAGMYLTGETKYNLREDKIKAKEFYARSINLYKKYCDEGDAKACFDLGDKYNGMRWNINQNYTLMMKYYKKSCELEYSFACNELGAAYKRGKGVDKDKEKSKIYYDKALVFYEKECKNNSAESCDRLSMIYRGEMYGTNDSAKGLALQKKAFDLYRELCNSNDSEGCWQVAKSYYIGSNVAIKVDWTKAKAYYKKSCDLGESSACLTEKEINPKEQIKYEKKMEFAAIDLQYRLKKKEEQDKWKARTERQRKEYFDSNFTSSEKEELLKKMRSDNITWRKESEKRLEKAKNILEKKQKEIEPFNLFLSMPKDNFKFYSYSDYPCKTEIITSDRNIILLEYAGTSMKGFEILTKYNLEDENYYNIIKKTTGHTYKKTYPIGSKWKVLGLYEHTRYNLNYFLLSSVDDKEKAWVYTNNFNYRQCKIEALNREEPFEIYTAVGSRKSIEF